MFDAAEFDLETGQDDCRSFGAATLVCVIADPGKGWRRRCGEVHVIVVETAEGAFTQVVRRPKQGREVFVERIFPGRATQAARDYATERFAPNLRKTPSDC